MPRLSTLAEEYLLFACLCLADTGSILYLLVPHRLVLLPFQGMVLLVYLTQGRSGTILTIPLHLQWK
jgi:hypothetical protein